LVIQMEVYSKARQGVMRTTVDQISICTRLLCSAKVEHCSMSSMRLRSLNDRIRLSNFLYSSSSMRISGLLISSIRLGVLSSERVIDFITFRLKTIEIKRRSSNREVNKSFFLLSSPHKYRSQALLRTGRSFSSASISRSMKSSTYSIWGRQTFSKYML
ncbi:hypothetical protein PMAYCL1PPCAC_24311, partial [Pristionchus mayeri]